MKRQSMIRFSKFLFLSCVLLNIEVNASETIGQKWVPLDHKGQALITTRKVEGKLGKPYTVELRINCGKDEVKNWETLEVLDSEAVCDVKPKSAKLTKDGKHISVLIRETDAEAFNTASRKMDPKSLGELEPRCKDTGKEFMFSVEQYCRDSINK
ncbi:MAG: hypothetical protein ACXVCP_18415 [Bdellovibrio sp.]